MCAVQSLIPRDEAYYAEHTLDIWIRCTNLMLLKTKGQKCGSTFITPLWLEAEEGLRKANLREPKLISFSLIHGVFEATKL